MYSITYHQQTLPPHREGGKAGEAGRGSSARSARRDEARRGQTRRRVPARAGIIVHCEEIAGNVVCLTWLQKMFAYSAGHDFTVVYNTSRCGLRMLQIIIT